MSLTVRIIAPTGRDADLLITMMRQNGIAAEAITSFSQVAIDDDEHRIGPLFLAEEALTPQLTKDLRNFVKNQPSWSDIPVLVALRANSSRDESVPGQQLLSFGLPVYLERPLRASTLISSVNAALRARERQYENRDALLARDEAVKELQREREALIRSEKLAAVGRLAASISHEINNPLEAITNLIYILHGAPELSAHSLEMLGQADEELKRVSQIVSHTLRFHRQATSATRISALELFEPTLGIYGGRLKNSRVKIDVDHRSSEAVLCREGDIRQVLNNLIGNAIDAMKAGGRLRIRTRASHFWREAEKTPVSALRITVADTGHGFGQETRKNLFEPFFTTKGLNGTGLGLWISFNIVEKHGGLLQVHSSQVEGRSGTVFSILLPTEPCFE